MRSYKLKGIALRNYNDSIRKIKVEKDEEVIENRGRYEELFAKGFVSEGTIIEDKPAKKVIIDKIKEED